MALRRRLDWHPGTTWCDCGYNLALAATTNPSSMLLTAQLTLDGAMDGRTVDLAGDRLEPDAFFVVF